MYKNNEGDKFNHKKMIHSYSTNNFKLLTNFSDASNKRSISVVCEAMHDWWGQK